MHHLGRSLFSLAAAAAVATLGCTSVDETPVTPSTTTTPPAAVKVEDARLEVAVLETAVNSTTDVSAKCEPTPPTLYKVTVVGTSTSTVTNGDGVFYLSNLPEGSITIHFSAPGVDAHLKISGLVNGQTLFLKVKIQGDSIEIVSSRSQVV